jgi:hypothetical protein
MGFRFLITGVSGSVCILHLNIEVNYLLNKTGGSMTKTQILLPKSSPPNRPSAGLETPIHKSGGGLKRLGTAGFEISSRTATSQGSMKIKTDQLTDLRIRIGLLQEFHEEACIAVGELQKNHEHALYQIGLTSEKLNKFAANSQHNLGDYMECRRFIKRLSIDLEKMAKLGINSRSQPKKIHEAEKIITSIKKLILTAEYKVKTISVDSEKRSLEMMTQLFSKASTDN